MLGSNQGCECLSLTDELKNKITLNYQDFAEITAKTRGLHRKGVARGVGFEPTRPKGPQT